MMTSPTMSAVFRRAKTTPRSLLSQPRSTKLNIPSRALPRRPSRKNTTMRIRANATTFITCSDAVMYCATQAATTSANLADAQMPTIMEIMEIAWAMKPFLMPWTRAGMKQIKRMISRMFIFALKCLYLQIQISQRDFLIAKIDNNFYL